MNFQPVHGRSGWEKGHIERALGSVGTLFAQFVAGYTGFSAERRGPRAGQQAVWSLLELQELLDEWIVVVFSGLLKINIRLDLLVRVADMSAT